MRTWWIGLFVGLLSLLAAGGVTGQEEFIPRRAEALFARGLAAYRQKQFDQARAEFEQLLELPSNQRSSAALLMLGKTLFNVRRYQEALQTVDRFQDEYETSRYLGDARLVGADCLYALGRYAQAAAAYGGVLATPRSLELQARAAEQLAAGVENGYIGPEVLDGLRLVLGERRLEEVLLFGRARWFRRLGWGEKSLVVGRDYLNRWPEGVFADLIDEPVGETEDGGPLAASGEAAENQTEVGRGKRPVRLGVLLPLSGSERQYGEDLLAGIQLANRELGGVIELVVQDTGYEYGELPISESQSGQLLRTVWAAQALVAEEVIAIVGPVFSHTAVAAGVVAQAAGVPLLAPLAQQSNLDLLGDYIFQLNTNSEIQGQVLAEYATLVLGLHNLAVLAPLSEFGAGFTREFVQVAHANGGNIVYQDWYVPNETKDFRLVFEDMRRVGFALTPPEPDSSKVDSLRWWGSDPNWGDASSVEEEPPDSVDIFIDSIDGLVVAVESFADAQTIAPQLSFYRLETQILGNALWHDSETMRQMLPQDRKYIQGCLFVSGYYKSAAETRRFIDEFRRGFRRNPGYAAYGYDAARIVMEGWNQGARSRADLRAWLAGLQGYAGASGQIGFKAGRRTNSELGLLTVGQSGLVRDLKADELPVLQEVEVR